MAGPYRETGLAGEREEEAGREQVVLFQRYAGPVRLTVFDGGHSVDMAAAFRWLEATTFRAATVSPGRRQAVAVVMAVRLIRRRCDSAGHFN